MMRKGHRIYPLCGHSSALHIPSNRDLCPACVETVRTHAAEIILTIFKKVVFPHEANPQDLIYNIALEIFRDNPQVILSSDIPPISQIAYKKILSLKDNYLLNNSESSTVPNQRSGIGLPSSVPLLSGTFSLPAGFEIRDHTGAGPPINPGPEKSSGNLDHINPELLTLDQPVNSEIWDFLPDEFDFRLDAIETPNSMGLGTGLDLTRHVAATSSTSQEREIPVQYDQEVRSQIVSHDSMLPKYLERFGGKVLRREKE